MSDIELVMLILIVSLIAIAINITYTVNILKNMVDKNSSEFKCLEEQAKRGEKAYYNSANIRDVRSLEYKVEALTERFEQSPEQKALRAKNKIDEAKEILKELEEGNE